MTKVDPHKMQADWSRYERRPTWSVVSSIELAQVLGVHLQTISNYKIRGILPPPTKHRSLCGNKNHYRISTLRAWLENKPENDIHWEWARDCLPDYIDKIKTLPELEYVVKGAYRVFDVEKPLIPADFSV